MLLFKLFCHLFSIKKKNLINHGANYDHIITCELRRINKKKMTDTIAAIA